MKPRGDHDEFNTPEEMRRRIAFIVCLAAFTAGILLTVAGFVAREMPLLAFGVLALAVSGLTRDWLQRRGGFGAADPGLRHLGEAVASLDDAHVAELVRLLREWEDLERKRGSADFDPWALQAVRHDIRVMVENDPALEGLFHEDHQRAA
jgi:hypothetical protein